MPMSLSGSMTLSPSWTMINDHKSELYPDHEPEKDNDLELEQDHDNEPKQDNDKEPEQDHGNEQDHDHEPERDPYSLLSSVALLPLGALTGSLLATFPLNYLGRKPTIMLSGEPLEKRRYLQYYRLCSYSAVLGNSINTLLIVQ